MSENDSTYQPVELRYDPTDGHPYTMIWKQETRDVRARKLAGAALALCAIIFIMAAVAITCAGCRLTPQQVQTVQKVESVAHQAVLDAQVALQAAKSNPQAVAAFQAKIQAVLPHTGAISTADAKLNAAYAAWIQGQGPIEDVEAALALVEPVLAPAPAPQ